MTVNGFDPSGYQIQVNIVTTDGTRFPLWLNGAVLDSGESIFNGETDQRDLPVVTSVELELNLGWGGKVTVNVSATFELGLALLNSEMFTIGNRIEVRMGYPASNTFTPWFSAMATKPSFSINPADGFTATLNGEGGAFMASRHGEPTTYTGTYRSVIEDTAERYGWELDIPDPAGDALDQERESFSQTVLDDWLYLQHLVRSAGYDALLLPSDENPGATKLLVLRREDNIASRPIATFVARGAVNFDTIFPILSFESQGEGVWMPHASGVLGSSDVNPDTREEAPVTEDPAVDSGPTTGDTVPAQGTVEVDGHQVGLRQEGTNRHVPMSRRNPMSPNEVLRAHSREQQLRAGLNVVITSFGIPFLLPDQMIALDGLGVFNGNYGIAGVTHSASESDWTMSIKMLSNALFGDAVAARLARQAQQPNTQQPEAHDDAQGSTSTTAQVEDDF